MSQFSLAAIVTHTCKQQQQQAVHSVYQLTALLPYKQLHCQDYCGSQRRQ
jgi:hypothetical protein